MWGASSKQCEMNCQCSGLITDSFTLNSGGSGKRRREEPLAAQRPMRPQTLKFSPLSPVHTPKRRVLGDIQNVPPSPFTNQQESPITSRLLNTSFVKRSSSKLTRVFEERYKFKKSNRENQILTDMENESVDFAKLETRVFKEVKHFDSSNKENLDMENQTLDFGSVKNRSLDFGCFKNQTSNFGKAKNRSLNFDKVEDQSFDGMESQIDFGKIPEGQSLPSTKLSSEETRDSPFVDGLGAPLGLQRSKTVKNWTLAKMTPDTTELTFSPKAAKPPVFGLDLDIADSDMDTLQDLDAEFENENFEACSKYEIISTDSPDIISKGRTDNRKITAKNLGEFGAPIAESEQSTSFNLKPTVSATRMLTFEEDFEFMSPENFKRVTQKDVSVKKSLKFSADTPTKNFLRHESSCSSTGSMSMSPLSSKLSLCTSESTASMESGFISEVEEPFLDLEDTSNSPKMANFGDLLSGQIKQDFVLKRPVIQRSLSYNVEASKVRVSLFEERKSHKRQEFREDFRSTKRRRSNCENVHPLVKKTQRPLLQRAFSENAASIMSALARSVSEPDLIGDFSQPCALPVTRGDHADLKSISGDTLAALLRGDYSNTIGEVQVIDCRYPYEFEGGHIRGARNLYTPDMVLTLLESPPSSPGAPDASGGPPEGSEGPQPSAKRKVLLFHCEFSLERGPKLSRCLRSADRARNADSYPALRHPEVYLLHGGYAAFHATHAQFCEPAGYTAMLDPRHRLSLRQARSMK